MTGGEPVKGETPLVLRNEGVPKNLGEKTVFLGLTPCPFVIKALVRARIQSAIARPLMQDRYLTGNQRDAAAKSRSRRDHAPAGRRSGAGRSAAVNVVVKIPYYRLPCNRVEQEVIWFAVAVKIGCPDQCITTCNRRPRRGAGQRRSR